MDAGPPPDSDDALMQAYGRGDVAAFEALYARHRLPLHAFLQRQLRDASVADELFQETWQRVVAQRERFVPNPSFRAWLYSIAHSRLNDHWRRQAHRPAAPADSQARLEALSDGRTPERVVGELDQRLQLQRALDALPDEQRTAVMLRLEQEMTLEEIGEVTGVGRETVKSRLRYAMDRLKAGMAA